MTESGARNEIVKKEHEIKAEYAEFIRAAKMLAEDSSQKSSNKTALSILVPIMISVVGFVLCGSVHPAFVLVGIGGILLAIFLGRYEVRNNSIVSSRTSGLNSIINYNINI